MRLIADSGSTKTVWAILHPDGQTDQFQTIGLNPYFVSSATVTQSLTRAFPKSIDPMMIKELHFYGAGCSGRLQSRRIFEGLENFLPTGIIYVNHDLLGAARAMYHDQPGMIAILGTGASTGFYDGKKIDYSMPSLGYILGDEGSGASMGRQFIKKFLEQDLPPKLGKKFYDEYQMDLSEILEAVYNKPHPNRFLGQFTRFIYDYIHNPAISAIVSQSFNDFLNKQIRKYKDYNMHRLRCVGSVAYIFQDFLIPIAKQMNIEIDAIKQEPIDGLIEYHKKFKII